MKDIKTQLEEYQVWRNTNKYTTFRYDIINAFIKKYNYANYLEIGVRTGINLREVIAVHKDGVDPGVEGTLTPETNYPITSDKFFELIHNHDIKYDIIFVDGLHQDYQVYTDIINALNHLTTNGTIVCHDMNPLWEITQRNEGVTGCGCWNGSCWKAWAKLRSERSDLEMYVVDTDHGCGVIRLGKQNSIHLPKNAFDLDFEYLENNRKELLNLITVDEFFKKLND
jgi:hypothetical protein